MLDMLTTKTFLLVFTCGRFTGTEWDLTQGLDLKIDDVIHFKCYQNVLLLGAFLGKQGRLFKLLQKWIQSVEKKTVLDVKMGYLAGLE